MKVSSQLKHKALILVAVPLVFQFVFVATLTVLLRQAEAETLRESHSKLILAESNSVLRNFIDAGMALYMYQLSDSQTFLERFQDLSNSIPEKIRTLRVMLRDSPNQAASLDRVERISNAGLKILGQASMLISEGESVSRLKSSRQELNNMIQELMSEIQRFSKEQEKAEHVNPEAAAQAKDLVVRWLAVGVMVNIIIAVILALYFNKTTTSRLNVLMDNTEHLAHGQTLSPFVGGVDEIAKLDKVFHRMADASIEAARRKKELMAMVAHDLRTPLTSIRASLSLMSMGALGEIPEKAKLQVDGAEKNTIEMQSSRLKVRRDLYGIDDFQVAETETELVRLYLETGDGKSAELYANQAFKTYNQMRLKRRGTGVQETTLAEVFERSRDYSKSETMYSRALAAQMKRNKKTPAMVGGIYQHLASIYKQQGKQKESERAERETQRWLAL